jgi:8-oxo-dGTP diphosphatase
MAWTMSESRGPVDVVNLESRGLVDVVNLESRGLADVVNLESRRPVDVAVGVLIDRDGRFLLTSRPEGKVYAGYWEFPGGKIEAGETVAQALQRELHEELGITIGAAQPWQVEIVDYPHARVRLHFCKVFDWHGEFQMREGQSMVWEHLPVQSRPVLPGTVPVLRWFATERNHSGPTHLD